MASGVAVRKNSDASTVVDGARKNSLETNSMAFEAHEEAKESMIMESLDERYLKDRRNINAQKNSEERAGSSSRPTFSGDD